jgi:hypothetical protein
MSLGEILFKKEDLPEWVKNCIEDVEKTEKTYDNLDDVREKYRKLRNRKDD